MRVKILNTYVIAFVLGILVGTVGSFFILSIKALSLLMVHGYTYVRAQGWPVKYVSALVSMVMIYVSWLMVKLYAPEASGSGVQEIEGALAHKRPVLWHRLLPIKFIGGVLAISSKLVVGREGPTIQIGGNLGAMVAERLGLSRHHRDALIAAGSAAGLATAFNAPLAGILFVLEEMRRDFPFSFTSFSAVAICCVSATIVLHLVVGTEPAIPMAVFHLPSLHSLSLFFLFGIVVGGVGVLFNHFLMKSLYQIDRITPRMRKVYVVLVGILVGLLAYLAPDMVGGGYDILEKSLTMRPTFAVLATLVIARFFITILCYSTGVPGGLFAPMLALGALIGLGASYLLQWLMIDITVHPGMFAVAGMGALFAAIVRAPVTGIVLVVEMTQNYSLILPLMVTCLTATTIGQLSGNKPVYTLLLQRTLKNAN